MKKLRILAVFTALIIFIAVGILTPPSAYAKGWEYSYADGWI